MKGTEIRTEPTISPESQQANPPDSLSIKKCVVNSFFVLFPIAAVFPVFKSSEKASGIILSFFRPFLSNSYLNGSKLP